MRWISVPAAAQPAAEWDSIIGGTATPGNRWRLVFTSGTKQVQAALGRGSKSGKGGGGSYFPLTACQRWDAARHEIENGIYLGRFAALTFSGPYSLDGKILAFDFDKLKLRLGGWATTFSLKAARDPRCAAEVPCAASNPPPVLPACPSHLGSCLCAPQYL